MSGGERKKRTSRGQGWEEAGGEFYQESYPADVDLDVLQRDPSHLATLLPSKQSRAATAKRVREVKPTLRRRTSTRSRYHSTSRRASTTADVHVAMLPDLSAVAKINEEIRKMGDAGTISSNSLSVALPETDESDYLNEEFSEPEKKRPKKLEVGKAEKLEFRLTSILCCSVCLDLPKSAVYQCTNGHLMCAGCFTHLLADARLRDEIATCPNCRIEISKSSASRNLAVEKAVSELPSKCHYCAKEFPRNILERHEEMMCEERIANCKYSRIGCPWRGPFHEEAEHENVCTHPHRSGVEVMDALRALDLKFLEEKSQYDCVFELLSYEKITFNDLQFKPYRTDEFIHKLFYETSRFSAFSNQWVVKARINNCQRDPTQSSIRDMTYQLILKTSSTFPLNVHFLILRGPFGDMKVNPKMYKFEFNDNENESPYVCLPLPDTGECNRLLAAKAINFRLIMFLMSK